MKRILLPLSGMAAFMSMSAFADEVRHTAFPSTLVGTWAETAEHCTAKDKFLIRVEVNKYSDGDISCTVGWIVETAASRGTNYAAHLLCTGASGSNNKTQPLNIIIRSDGSDHVVIGKSFEDLKTYQRCPPQ